MDNINKFRNFEHFSKNLIFFYEKHVGFLKILKISWKHTLNLKIQTKFQTTIHKLSSEPRKTCLFSIYMSWWFVRCSVNVVDATFFEVLQTKRKKKLGRPSSKGGMRRRKCHFFCCFFSLVFICFHCFFFWFLIHYAQIFNARWTIL